MDKALLAELEWIAFEQDIPLDRLIEDFNRKDTHLRDVGSNSLVQIFSRDTPGQFVQSQKVNIIKRIAKEKNVKSNSYNKANYEPQLG